MWYLAICDIKNVYGMLEDVFNTMRVYKSEESIYPPRWHVKFHDHLVFAYRLIRVLRISLILRFFKVVLGRLACVCRRSEFEFLCTSQ